MSWQWMRRITKAFSFEARAARARKEIDELKRAIDAMGAEVDAKAAADIRTELAKAEAALERAIELGKRKAQKR